MDTQLITSRKKVILGKCNYQKLICKVNCHLSELIILWHRRIMIFCSLFWGCQALLVLMPLSLWPLATITVSATAKASSWEKSSEEFDFSVTEWSENLGCVGLSLSLLVFQRPRGTWLFSFLLSCLECLWKMSLVLRFNGNTQWIFMKTFYQMFKCQRFSATCCYIDTISRGTIIC